MWDAIAKLLLEGGSFLTGVIVASIMNHFLGKEARKERQHTRKLDLEREAKLQLQISQQQDRINKLHSDKETLAERARLLEKEVEKVNRRLENASSNRLL